MQRMWTVTCKSCSQTSSVREDPDMGQTLFRKTEGNVVNLMCPHCGIKHNYSEAQLAPLAGQVQ